MVDIYGAAILLLFGFSEVKRTLLITSELTNQCARNALFTCLVYTKHVNTQFETE